MRIADLEGPFYHGTTRPFKTGFLLRPQRDGYAQGDAYMDANEKKLHAAMEKAVDSFRPPDAVSRFKAVFMISGHGKPLDQVLKEIDWAGGYLDFVYEVEPMAHITKCNLSWYTVASEQAYVDSDTLNMESLEHCARNYWSAAPGPRTLYEYLTPSAIIRKLVHQE